ncbi:MAG: hypothetical protein V3U73_15525 [bacterium]
MLCCQKRYSFRTKRTEDFTSNVYQAFPAAASAHPGATANIGRSRRTAETQVGLDKLNVVIFKMADEATKSLRSLFLASLLIVLVWLISWPSAIERFKHYRDAGQLHAWLFLKERLDNFGREVFSDSDPEELIDKDYRSVEDFTGGYEEWLPLILETTWPIVDQHPLILEPEFYYPHGEDREQAGSSVRVYRPRVLTDILPFSDYYVVFVGTGSIRVVPTGDPDFMSSLETTGLREISEATASRNRPRDWDSIGLRLARYGFKEHPIRLTSTSRALERFQADSDPSGLTVQIFGLQLSIGLFFSSVGVFLGLIAFAMIGPLITLRRSSNSQISQPWIMIVSTRGGFMTKVLEATIMVISLLWALLPLVLLVMQWYAKVELRGVERLAMFIGALGLAFSALVYCWASFEMLNVRRRTVEPNRA